MSPQDDPSPLPDSLASLGRVGMIGAGAVGAALARMLAARGADIAAVASRAPERAAMLAAALPGAAAVTPDQLVRACDLVFLAVPDDAIAPLAAALPWHASQGAIHLSGAKDAAALGVVSAAGAHPAALHPLMTFARAPLDMPVAALLERVAGCAWALEADDAGLAATLARIVAALDGRVVRLAAGDRVPYHIAAVFASNYVVTLIGAAVALWEGFGVGRDEALRALLPLLRGAVENLSGVGLPDALSGPVARGDAGTVAAHLAWLDAHAIQAADHAGPPELAALRDAYVALARLALPLGQAKGTLDTTAAAQLIRLLASTPIPPVETDRPDKRA
jgi:predicted short-subunit dehydrogenase-like oxidoreductase (DUF2520 family)